MWLFRGLLALSLLSLGQVRARAEEPWAVITGQSVSDVRSGLRQYYKRLDRKELVAAMDTAAATNLISGNLRGLDLHRPLGGYVLPGRNGLGTTVSFVPVTGEVEFRGFLERHGLTPSPAEEGVSHFQVPLVGTVFLKFAKQHAWFALAREDLDGSLPDPAQSIPAVHRKTTLAATVYLERVPADLREVWTKRAEQGLGLLMGGNPAGGQLGQNLLLPVAGSTMRLLAGQARTVTLLANADTKKDEFTAEAVIEPRPGTPWAEQAKRLQEKSMKTNLDARTWAKLRGIPEEKSELTAKAVFTQPDAETIILTAEGGDAIHLKARMSGAVLAYHAALEKDKPPKEKKLRKRDRRRD